jgi:hypothetical protein
VQGLRAHRLLPEPDGARLWKKTMSAMDTTVKGSGCTHGFQFANRSAMVREDSRSSAEGGIAGADDDVCGAGGLVREAPPF